MKNRPRLLPLLGATAALIFAPSAPLQAAKPNLIVILADDIGIEWFTPYGSEEYKTPNLDRLAKEGVYFNHCYAQPLCTPSRVKIMTGKYNFRNYESFGDFPDSDLKNTFATLLDGADYQTCMAGKWQLGSEDPGAMGFDAWLKYNVGQDRVINQNYFWDPRSQVADRITEGGRTWEPQTDSNYGPDIIVDFINGFVNTNKEGPFFVYYPMLLTHEPFQPTPDSEDKDFMSLKDKAYTDAKWFPDMVAYMDKCVGRIVDNLKEQGVLDNTLILFVGDNGTGYHPAKFKGGVAIGTKGKMTDGGTRVPLIAYWPDGMEGERSSDDLVDLSDFYPTLAQAAGVPVPEGIDGVSFLPEIMGEEGTPRDWAFIFYTPNQPGDKPVAYWARTQRWKLYDDGRLIDVLNDPKEEAPIAESEGTPESREARALLQGAFDELGVTPETLNEVRKRSKFAKKYKFD